jgi:hypothetical protein
MCSSRKRNRKLNSDQQEPNSRGIIGDIRSARHNGAASLAELHEFIGSLKGRKPQEVVGITANNGLVRGLVTSVIGFIVVLLIFTAIPFFMAEDPPSALPPITPAANRPEPREADGSDQQPPATTAEGENVLDKLEIGETKEADPDENPLDGQFNDLLKDIK